MRIVQRCANNGYKTVNADTATIKQSIASYCYSHSTLRNARIYTSVECVRVRRIMNVIQPEWFRSNTQWRNAFDAVVRPATHSSNSRYFHRIR